VWISDGIHLFQGLSFTSSLAILMVAIRGSSRWKYALSLCLLGAGLLIREDTLTVVPVMFLLGYVYGLRNGTKQTYLYVYFGAMIVVCALFMIYDLWLSLNCGLSTSS